MDNLWIGIAGMLLILLGWVPETLDTIRKGARQINPAFASLYALGSAALALYAYSVGDPVFLLLNGFAAGMALVNLFYSLKAPRAAGGKPGRKALRLQ